MHLQEEEDISINEDLNSQENKIDIRKLFRDNKSYINTKNHELLINKKMNVEDFGMFNMFVNQSTKEEDNNQNKNQLESIDLPSKLFSKLNFNKSQLIISKEKEKRENEFLNKKRNRKDIFSFTKISKDKKFSKRGRKKMADKFKRKHNESSKDNITNKIKVHFFHYIRDIIKKNSIHEIIQFKKTKHRFISNLKKDKNEDLFKMKMKDILSKEQISRKYKKFNEYENKIIIEKIYKENKEKKVMKILKLTFNELFIIFRKKLKCQKDETLIKKISKKIKGLDLLKNNNYDDVDYLIEDIKKRNAKNKNMDEKELEVYIQKVKNVCCHYEEFFKDKMKRNVKKNNNLN